MTPCTRHIAKLALLCLSAALLFAAPKSAQAQCGTTPATGAINWTTNWCDEFNGAANSAISSANWTYDTGAGGWGNNELETYCAPTSNTSPCSSSTPNAYIDGSGHLAIKVYSVGSAYTSARLKTQGLQTFHSGRVEASIEIPSHAGLWPAFWMLGSQSGVSWPTVGESDILENWPTTSNIPGPGATGNRSTIHTKSTGGNGIGGAYTFPSGQQVNTAFHVYGQIWSANMIQFYVDDATKPFFVVTASNLPAGDVWPFSSSADPFFIIMNMAVGGTLGAPTDSATGTQPPMLVDYVRQYLPSAIPAPTLSPNGNITVKAGATTGNSTTMTVQNTLGTGRVAFSCTTTAPKASCVVTSADPVNKYTVDFSNASSDSATVTVTTTANTQHGGHSNGTTPGTYTVTVNAFTESSSDATKPSATTSFTLTVN
ncbi:MAG TPA: glycoside hydrolase family 16 protein [Terracidiphilus sp.]|nr:glycoside hydrolase family 16 protein [Terracidiphilus sp.]